jgi:uncharacterized protein
MSARWIAATNVSNVQDTAMARGLVVIMTSRRTLAPRAIWSLLLALLLDPCRIAAQQSGAAWTSIPLQSQILRQSRSIYVSTPPSYGEGKRSYPVLLVLDAEDNAQFAAAVANARFLASRTTIPELIVVGIPNGADRTHDLTPAAAGSTSKDQPTAGGADEFLAFILREVLPSARRRYRTLPATVLMGHSFGGLFGMYVAAKHPGTFAGTIAASPALWWNDSSVVQDYANSLSQSASSQRLFVTSGGMEAEIGKTVARFVGLLDSLRQTSESFASMRYPDDTHGLTPLRSLIDGLRFIFAPVSLAKLPTAKLGPGVDSVTVVDAVLQTRAQYAKGARSLSLPEPLPKEVLNRLGYNVLNGLKKPGLAGWVFRTNEAMHPNEWSVHDGLGDALLAMGDTVTARAEFEKAVSLAVRAGDASAGDVRSKLAKLHRR